MQWLIKQFNCIPLKFRTQLNTELPPLHFFQKPLVNLCLTQLFIMLSYDLHGFMEIYAASKWSDYEHVLPKAVFQL